MIWLFLNSGAASLSNYIPHWSIFQKNILSHRSLSKIQFAAALILIGITLAGCFSRNAQPVNQPTLRESPSETYAAEINTPRALTTAEPKSAPVSKLDMYAGLPVGFTQDGDPFRGDPNAPLTFIEYSDYLCPFCRRHASQTTPALLDKYAATGQVRFVFRDFSIPSLHPTAAIGHTAARCVAEQGAALFWAMHEQLFRTQTEWGRLADPSDFLAAQVAEIKADTEAYADCMAAGEQQVAVEKSTAAARAQGFTGTPSFEIVVNESGKSRQVIGALAFENFTQLIDNRLADINEAAGISHSQMDSAADSTNDTSDTNDTNDVAQESDALSAERSSALDGVETYENTPVGFTEDGYPFRGNVNAPITLVEYSDYLCPFCGRHFNQTNPALIEKYVQTGEVLIVFRDLPLVSLHPTAPIGHQAAGCVAEQSAKLFWTMHNELFSTQQQWNSLPNPSLYVEGLAEEIGADMDLYADCMEAGHTATAVDTSVTEGRELGFNGTPSFQFVLNNSGDTHSLVGAHPLEEFSRWIDALQADGQPPAEAEEEQPELPLWANAEGLAPDPNRLGYTTAGDPYKGNPDAALVVVEFADFQCPPCRDHAVEVQPTVEEKFIDSDQIMWVFKHLPLKEHPLAPVAAVAAECAGNQNQFWPMHDLLFEKQEQWAEGDTEAVLLTLAAELNLDKEVFSTCFNSRQALEQVLNDIYDAQGVVQTTPAFIFLADGRGSFSQGARQVEQFVKLIQSRLDATNIDE